MHGPMYIKLQLFVNVIKMKASGKISNDRHVVTLQSIKICLIISFILTERLQNKCTNCKGFKNTPILDKLLEYKRSWIQHVNTMPRNRLPRVMKYYSQTGRRNHGRRLKRLLDT